MHVAAYGRLGGEPREITTSTGTAMAVANVAVELADRHGEAHTQWLGVVAFGRAAETLLRHSKGEMISVSGRAQYNAYTDGNGIEREQLQVIADSVVSARSVRPSGGRKANGKRQGDRAAHQRDFAEAEVF